MTLSRYIVPLLHNQRRFNPKMLTEWNRVQIKNKVEGIAAYIPSPGTILLMDDLKFWCHENCRGRWSLGSFEDSSWTTVYPIIQGDYEIMRSVFFKHRPDAVRFKLLFFPDI